MQHITFNLIVFLHRTAAIHLYKAEVIYSEILPSQKISDRTRNVPFICSAPCSSVTAAVENLFFTSIAAVTELKENGKLDQIASTKGVGYHMPGGGWIATPVGPPGAGSRQVAGAYPFGTQ